MKTFVFISFFLLINISIIAQVNLDSLWAIWYDESAPDTSRALALSLIAWDGYLFSQPDSAFYFAMRVGIHTGPIVVGTVGVSKFQYDIWGDAVNTASRMENAGEVNKVNISQSTYELINEDPTFKFQSRGKIKVKGKGEIEMWFVS